MDSALKNKAALIIGVNSPQEIGAATAPAFAKRLEKKSGNGGT